MTHPYLTGTAAPRVFAHRGFVSAELAAAGVVENTRAAFAAAVAAGAEYLETDCHLTSDGVVVLCHDADLTRIAGDPRPVASVTSRELAELMADRGGLLTLEQALQDFPRARFNIDIKAAAAADVAGRILAPEADRVLITSFSDEYRLRTLRAAATRGGSQRPATSPGRRRLIGVLLALASGSRSAAARALSRLDALQIPERQGPVPVLSRRLIDEAQRMGVEVHVWTVNDPQRMRELAQLGVSGVITDRADLALDALG